MKAPEDSKDNAECAPSGGECSYFAAGRCRSCSLLEIAPNRRRSAKEHELQTVFAHAGIKPAQLFPLVEPLTPWGSRNKTKLSVFGTIDEPLLGIVGPLYQGIDLEGCLLPPPPIRALLATLKLVIQRYRLPPFDIGSQVGELKGIIICINHNHSEGMVRFVVRSTESVSRIRKAVSEITTPHDWIKVVSVNIQPVPAAIVEGPQEIVLTEKQFITEIYNGIKLHFAPQSFMQVTHTVAERLYHTFSEWVGEYRPSTVLDIFCGVGGFALHAARCATSVRGVEISPAAVASARMAAAGGSFDNATFIAADADKALDTLHPAPDLLVVNPPRRGLSTSMREAIKAAQPPILCYSSCNPATFARDVSDLGELYELVRAVPFDMFPLTRHLEVLGLLERRGSRSPAHPCSS